MVINEKCKICQIKRNNNRYPVAMVGNCNGQVTQAGLKAMPGYF